MAAMVQSGAAQSGIDIAKVRPAMLGLVRDARRQQLEKGNKPGGVRLGGAGISSQGAQPHLGIGGR